MTEEKISVSRGDIYYYKLGEGPSLLFLHGAIATPGAYASLLKLLANKYTVFAPTHPGHGNSFSIEPDWTIENFIETYHEILRALSFDPEILVGHSLGGAFALYLGSQNIGKRIIAFDPAGLPLPLTPAVYIQELFEEAKVAIAERPDLDYIKNTLPTAGTLVHTIVRHSGEIPWFYAKAPQIDISAQLAAIRVPTALLWGAQDKIVPLSLGKTMHELISTSTLTVLPNFGHVYPVTAPEETFREIQKVLAP